VTLGISEGDVLRLKNGSRKWWNGLDAKRKLDDVNDDPFSSADAAAEHYNKRCHYEYCFSDGGGTHYNGPLMPEGDCPHDAPDPKD